MFELDPISLLALLQPLLLRALTAAALALVLATLIEIACLVGGTVAREPGRSTQRPTRPTR